MPQIIVTIDTDGNVKLETKGFTGASCLQATLELEKALGKTTADTKTPEYHTRQQLKQGQ